MIQVSRGIRFMVWSAFLFSIMSVLVKAAGNRLPSQEIVFWRGLVTVVISTWALRRSGVPMWGNRRRLLVVRAGFGFLALSAFFYAVVHLPLAAATVIHYTNPVFTAVVAAIFLGERVRPRDATALVASLGGVALIARPEFLFAGNGAQLDPVAVSVALLGAVFSAVAYTTVRGLGKTEHPLVIVHYFAVAVTIGSLPVLFGGITMPRGVEWPILLGVGVSTHFAQVAMTRGLAIERAGRAMTAAYVTIVFAAVWGALLFAEFPDGLAIAGAVLIVGSTFWLGRSGRGGAPRPAA